MTLEEYVKEKYVGKTLLGCEFGMNQPGCQSVIVPQEIAEATIGVTLGDRDPCIWLTLFNGDRAYFYSNEEIYIK